MEAIDYSWLYWMCQTKGLLNSLISTYLSYYRKYVIMQIDTDLLLLYFNKAFIV